MAHTRTGSFPIGFRIGGSEWQKNISDVIGFARDSGFAGLDLPANDPAAVGTILEAGLAIGTVDVPQAWTDLCSADAGKRSEAAKEKADQIAALVEAGAKHFFCVILPEDQTAERSENLEYAADGYGQLCEHIADTGAKILLEGWPGGYPYYASLACTPADYRLVFDRVGSDVLGVNYDPSHLVRMHIDPLRFIQEFSSRIFHVHAKDTELLDDVVYDYGITQLATEATKHGYGEHIWRYTIPGHGCIRWTRLFAELANVGYDGMVCIELEDEQFAGSKEAEQRGLLGSRDFLVYA